MTFESWIWVGKQDSWGGKVLVYFVTNSPESRIQVCDELIELSTNVLVKICPVATSMETMVAGLPEVESGVYNSCQYFVLQGYKMSLQLQLSVLSLKNVGYPVWMILKSLRPDFAII